MDTNVCSPTMPDIPSEVSFESCKLPAHIACWNVSYLRSSTIAYKAVLTITFCQPSVTPLARQNSWRTNRGLLHIVWDLFMVVHAKASPPASSVRHPVQPIRSIFRHTFRHASSSRRSRRQLSETKCPVCSVCLCQKEG